MNHPNLVVYRDGFHISYNPTDVSVYGDVTTAIVNDDMAYFVIVNGNHLDTFNELSLDAMLRQASRLKLNHRSDPFPKDVDHFRAGRRL